MKEITTSKNILNENSAVLQDFFKDISKYPILDGDTQVELAKKALKGDTVAREKLINSNLRFVVTCAKHYVGQGVPLIDLIQCGLLGLCQAVDHYDPDRGYKFISFAVWYIRREIIKELYNTGRTIRYPITYISKITKVKKAYDAFLSENQREPTEEELIKLTNLTQKQYNSVVLDKSYCQSFDTPIMEGEKTTLKDVLVGSDDPDPFISDTINESLIVLNDRERKVISEFYGLNGCRERPIKDIAEEMNLSQERIRQLRKSGIKKLRQKKGKTLKTLL